MPVYLTSTTAHRVFKQKLGHANHLIITLLVGLEAVERGLIKDAPEALRAAWSPKDTFLSVRRSRRFLLDMALLASIDALDTYIRTSCMKPFLMPLELKNQLDGCGRSVTHKFEHIEKYYPAKDKIVAALIAAMITWRNHSAHSLSTDEIQPEHRKVLEDHKDVIAKRFNGLDSHRLLEEYDTETAPTFKEIASFINATHHYISDLEKIQFSRLNLEEYLKEFIWVAISSNKEKRLAKLHSIWGRAEADRPQYVQRFLKSHGLSLIKPTTHSIFREFPEDLITRLVGMKPKEVYEWLGQDTEPKDAKGHSK